MTDRELLELAAKAVGYSLGPEWDTYKSGIWVNGTGDGDGFLFSPLTDDGDALRLATDLRMTVRTGPCEAAATTIAGVLRGAFPVEETIFQAQDAAVRRVIVRAAAEFGENME